MKDNQGLALSSSDGAAVEAYNRAVNDLLDYRTTAMPSVKRAIELDPGFCMAHVLRGYMLMNFSTNTVYGGARTALKNAEEHERTATARERAHVQALACWLQGDLQRLCALWEAILAEHPLDILALRLHHFVSFWMGRSQSLMELPAAVLPAWERGTPSRGNVLGMLCFGLEECRRCEEAEPYGREAVALNRNDLWSVHAVTHVLESQNRYEEGLAWLDLPADIWDDRNPFRGHIWWHRGLFLIEAGRLDEAMALYDRSIYDTKSDFYLDVQNAAALLVRIGLKGYDVGDRWQALAVHAKAHVGDHVLVFTDLNWVIALARTRRFAEAREFIASMRAAAAMNDFHVAQTLRRVGVPVAESIVAFEEGHSRQALQTLMQHKAQLIEVGASHAQRDLILLFAMEAARRAGQDAVLGQLMRVQEFLAAILRSGLPRADGRRHFDSAIARASDLLPRTASSGARP